MRLSFWFSGSVVITALACTTDYQKGLDDPQYAGPNALADQVPPGPSNSQPGAASSSGGGNTSQPLCVAKGGSLVAQTTPCAVTFTKILAAFNAASCSNAGSCHGTGNPEPLITTDKDVTYASLTKFTVSTAGDKPYVNPCSTELTQSVIAANIDPAAPPADRGTIMPPSVGLSALVADVKTWVQCGAPNN